MLAVSRGGPTTSARLIFACAWRGSRSSACAASTNSGGSSASARTCRSRPERRRAPRRPARASRRRRAASEFASVLRRWANAPSTTLRISREVGRAAACGGTRRAPSRRWAAAGTPSGRPGGSPFARVASWTSTETAPYAFVEGTAKKRSATSRCTITHQQLDARQAVEALGDDRRRDVVGQVRDELRRRRVEARRGRAASASPQWSVDVRAAGERRASCGSSAPVELDRVDVGAPLGEDARSATPRPGPDLEHDIGRAELGQPARSRRGCCRRRGSAGRGTSWAAARSRRAEARRPRSRSGRSPARARATSSPARLGEHGERVQRRSPARSRLPRSGCGARYGLSVSARMRSAGHGRGGLAELGRLRIRHVAGERDVVAALERRRRAARAREAVEDRRCPGSRPGRPRCRRPRRGCGSRPAGPPSPRARAGARRARAGRAAARDRGSSRGPSRRPRRPAGGRAARRARPTALPPASPAWCGSIPSAAKTPSSAAAIASAAWHDAIPVPIVTIRETPTARARSTRNAAGSSQPSRWAWVSITADRLRRGQLEAREERRSGLDAVRLGGEPVGDERPVERRAGCCSAARIAAAVSGM